MWSVYAGRAGDFFARRSVRGDYQQFLPSDDYLFSSSLTSAPLLKIILTDYLVLSNWQRAEESDLNQLAQKFDSLKEAVDPNHGSTWNLLNLVFQATVRKLDYLHQAARELAKHDERILEHRSLRDSFLQSVSSDARKMVGLVYA